MEILRIENLSFTYPASRLKALDSIDFSVKSGEFIVICGESGCGKTTLLRLLKRELAPFGEKVGSIYYNGRPQQKLDGITSVSEIGFIQQNPNNQTVTDKVWSELAFGLENIGVETDIIRRRIGETASYFGIQGWFRKSTDELSGGEKQLLNLSAVMVMQPKILLLDEPTSQLDPIAAAGFTATLQKLNRELGLTVILAEHRLEEIFPIADRVMVMEEGKIIAFDSPRNIGGHLRAINKNHNMLAALPAAMRIFTGLGRTGECPMTVKEGRIFIEENYSGNGYQPKRTEYVHNSAAALEMKDVFFRYEKDEKDVLRGVNLKIYQGEFYCLLGGNGTGKTTVLNVFSALNRAYRGKVFVFGKQTKEYKDNSLYRGILAYLPQDPQNVFFKDTVKEDFESLLRSAGIENEESSRIIDEISHKIGISHLLKSHPLDLSGGEIQKCAIAKALLTSPKVLLLDEPTKGLDVFSKQGLANILKSLIQGGMTVLMVTHDVEFAAENAHRCGLFFDGEILLGDTPKNFFAKNNFYTTAANRIARNVFADAITVNDVVLCCKGNEK